MAGAAEVGYSLPPYGKLERAGVGNFIQPGWFSSGFSLGQGLIKNRVVWNIRKGSFCQLATASMKGLFSNIHHQDLVEFLEVKHKIMGLPLYFLTLDLSVLSLRQLQFTFS